MEVEKLLEGIDSTARRVASEGFEGPQKINHHPKHKSYVACPELKKVPTNIKNLTGVSYGDLAVLGYYGHGKWVVRCLCGIYETRRSRIIIKRDSGQCVDCNYRNYLANNKQGNSAQYQPRPTQNQKKKRAKPERRIANRR